MTGDPKGFILIEIKGFDNGAKIKMVGCWFCVFVVF